MELFKRKLPENGADQLRPGKKAVMHMDKQGDSAERKRSGNERIEKEIT